MLIQSPPNPKTGLIPHTIFAVRVRGEDGWRLGTRPVTPDLLEKVLNDEGKEYETLRVVFQHEVLDGFGEHFIDEHTRNRGWLFDYSRGLWIAPDESILAPSGSSVEAMPDIVLNEIHCNRITFTIGAGGNEVPVWGDEFLYDPLPPIADLISRLKLGQHGHACIDDFEMHVLQTERSDFVRFIARSTVRNTKCFWLDVLCCKDTLIDKLAQFLRDLSAHPDFIHQYLLDDAYNQEEWDAALELADISWEQAVKDGKVDEDDYQAEIEWANRVVREKVSIPDQSQEFIGLYMKMLTTLDVPERWVSKL